MVFYTLSPTRTATATSLTSTGTATGGTGTTTGSRMTGTPTSPRPASQLVLFLLPAYAGRFSLFSCFSQPPSILPISSSGLESAM